MDQSLSLKSFVVLMKATRSLEERIKQDINSYGVNLSEFSVLEVLYHKGQQTVQQICNSVLIASGSMTYVIDKLEKKNMLERNACPKDRRVIHVGLTNQGNEFMSNIFPQHQKVIEDLFEEVTIEEKEILINALKKVGLKAQNQL